MTSPATYADREVQVNGLKLHYQEWGDPAAPPLLMLHGFGVSGHMFDEFADRLRHQYRLIALDQRGHGDSDWSEPGDYSRDAFVSDVEGFVTALGIERFVLMGHSMGGLNSVAYASAYPQRVKALILVDVGPEAAKEGVDNIVRFTRGPDELDFEEFVEMAHRFNQRRTIENIRERMRHRLRPLESGKWTWKFDARFRKPDSGLRIGSELSNDESWKLYRAITASTLLVRGAESDVLTEEVAQRCVREMRRARLVVVPGAGHSVPGDNPDGFTEAVTTFLDDVERGKFEPLVVASPPPLAELVTAQAAAERRRRPGTTTLALVVAGAAVAIIAALLVSKGRSKTAKAKVEAPGRDASRATASRAAAAVVEDLGRAGRRGTKRAASLVSTAESRRVTAVIRPRAPAKSGAKQPKTVVKPKQSKKRRVAGFALALAMGPLAPRRKKPSLTRRLLLPW
jgi:pimeloyl-ACP methyl ester carboxylesterase